MENKIYSSLSFPTVTSRPSPQCLQWTEDGQLLVLTKNTVYVLTPEFGINFDKGSMTKKERDGENQVGWFKTAIEYQKGPIHNWVDTSQEWGAVALGAVDVSLKAVACSPSGISSNGRCVIGVLNSNMDLALWAGSKNHVKGEWTKKQDITAFLVSTFTEKGSSPLQVALRSQVTCIAWSVQPFFSVNPSPLVDASLLVAGNRAGELIILRYSEHESVQLMETCEIGERWVTHVAISLWSKLSDDTCEAHLSFGLADGSVGVLKISQRIIKNPGAVGISFTTAVDLEPPRIVHKADKKGFSPLLIFFKPECEAEQRILVNAKPGLISLWANSSNSKSLGWSETRSLRLQTQKISVGSSALHPVSGIKYMPKNDCVLISLFDGSFHVIYNVSTNPTIEPPESSSFNSSTLSRSVRAVFSEVELEEVLFSDMNQTSGMVPFGDMEAYLWLHESSRPADFSYKHDAKHNSVVVMARLWVDENWEEGFVRGVSRVFDVNAFNIRASPLHTLCTLFWQIRRNPDLAYTHLIGTLTRAEDDIPEIDFPNAHGEITSEFRMSLRGSLEMFLFGSFKLYLLRLKLCLLNFLWKTLAEDPQMKQELGGIAEGLLNELDFCNMLVIVKHLTAVNGILSAKDLPFISKLAALTLKHGTPTGLMMEMRHTLQKIEETLSASERLPTTEESCPACLASIPQDNVTTGVCANGHIWARCSVTGFILSTPFTRTCIGCCRKAFVAPSDGGGNSLERGWFVEQLLEAISRCLFCGNSFVRIV